MSIGDFNGNLNIYDIERLDKPIYTAKAHNSMINSIDACGNGISNGFGNNEIVTGSKDGSVKLWDPRSKENVFKLQPKVNTNIDCWSVCFGNNYNNNSDKNICCGYNNGDIKLINLLTNKITLNKNLNNGITNIEFDRKNIKMNKLLVSTLESKYYIFNMEFDNYCYLEYKLQNGMNSTIWNVKTLPQNRDVFVSCIGNGYINLFRYEYPSKNYIKNKNGKKEGVIGSVELINETQITNQPINSWNWNKHKNGLACMTSLDQSIKVIIVTKLDKL